MKTDRVAGILLTSFLFAPLTAAAQPTLGGMGSGLAYLGGDYFIALPDRGPNAHPYAPCLDDTASYINRFHTLHMSLAPSDPGSTLLSNRTPLVYGAGCGGVGTGVPALNAADRTFYFTGRSDGFDPAKGSTSPRNARFDTDVFSLPPKFTASNLSSAGAAELSGDRLRPGRRHRWRDEAHPLPVQ